VKMQSLQSSSARVSSSVSGLRVRAFAPAPVQRGSLQVTAAITRQKKEQIVSDLKQSLDSSLIVFSSRFKGVDVPTMQKMRKTMPEGTQVFICKNNLMKVALKEMESWSALQENNGCAGENMWFFVPEENLQESIRAYFTFEGELFTAAQKNAPKGTTPERPISISSVCFEKKYLSSDQLKSISDLPTKKELLATIAGLAKQPATKIATGVKAVPTKLARAINLVAELSDDKSVTVASLVKA